VIGNRDNGFTNHYDWVDAVGRNPAPPGMYIIKPFKTMGKAKPFFLRGAGGPTKEMFVTPFFSLKHLKVEGV